jgi:hypothetical protein
MWGKTNGLKRADPEVKRVKVKMFLNAAVRLV